MKKKNIGGFTLIEVIIYIGLFSILMGTAFISAYQLIDGSTTLNSKNTVQEEGNFVMRKLNWALTGISSFTNTSSTLHTNTYDGDQIDIRLVGTKIEMKENQYGNTFIPITTDNVVVNSLEFTRITGILPGVSATVEINGKHFGITKYIRK